MTIRSKITTGYLVLLLAMTAVLSYQAYVVNRLQDINAELQGINLRAADLFHPVRTTLRDLQGFTSDFFVFKNPDYLEKWQEFRSEGVESRIDDMEDLKLSFSQQRVFNRFKSLWAEYSKTARKLEEEFEARDETWSDLFENDWTIDHKDYLIATLEKLIEEAGTFLDETRNSISDRVDESDRTSKRADLISWLAASGALVLSLVVGFFVVSSIHRPLKNLTRATEVISRGEFSYRLQPSGDDELAQLSRDFDRMAGRLNELNELKNDFLSHVSHELKAPLASMQETTRALLEELPGPINPNQERLLELTLHGGDRLRTLIGNLLDLGRMEANALRYDFLKHDFSLLVKSLIEEAKPKLREKKLKFDVHLPAEPVWVDCDGDRIVQVVSNLVDNALKFSPPEGVISIQLHTLKTVPGGAPGRNLEDRSRLNGLMAELLVSDTGPGVPKQERRAIFEKFHQVGFSPNSSRKGVGLGLAICQKIVRAHGGLIWVERNSPGGSVFRMILSGAA